MSENQHIKEALDYYLAGNRPTHHALMLSGAWGSGKTHFIKDYIKQINSLSPHEAAEKNINSKCFYISLYGLQTLEELQKQLFIAFYPTGGKTAKTLTNIEAVSVNLPFLSFSLKPKDIGKILAKTASNLKKHSLVFDDLERCHIPIKSLFGFINQLVEHNGQKVILIANEEKIPGKNYAEIKEKLVGMSLEMQTSPDSVLGHFIKELEEGAARDCAEQNRTIIGHIFHALEIRNYRSLRMALYDFSRLLSAIADIFPPFMEDTDNALEARRQLLILVLVMELQYRRHSNDDAHLEEILAYTFLTNEESEKLSNEERGKLTKQQDNNIQKINKYLDPLFQDNKAYKYSYGIKITTGSAILPPALIALFLVKGQFDFVWAEQYLKQHFLFADKFPQPIWLRLQSGSSSYNQEEFQALLQEIEQRLSAETIKDFGIILYLASRFSFMQEIENFRPDFLKPDIAAYFTNYMDRLVKKGTLNLEEADSIIYKNAANIDGFFNYEFGKKAEFKKIIDHYQQHKEQWHRPQQQQKAEELYSLLENKASNHQVTYWLENNKQQAFFQYLDSGKIAKLFFKQESGARTYPVIYSLLKLRRRQIKENSNLAPETAWFDELKIKLEGHAATLPPPFRKRAENAIQELFKEEQSGFRKY